MQKIKVAARGLKRFPERGGVIAEFEDDTLREIFVGSYRIIYRYRGTQIELCELFTARDSFARKICNRIELLAGARITDPDFLERD